MKPSWIPVLCLVLLGCDPASVGGSDAPVTPDTVGPTVDLLQTDRQTTPPGDLVKLPDGSKPDPCSPLPAGCLCQQACNAGQCDNTLCPCQPISGSSYGKLTALQPCGCNPATHGDMNLLLRKWKAVAATKGLVDVGGPTDGKAPQLYTLFVDERVPVFSNVYQVEGWDWGCNCPKGYVTDPEVTLAGMATALGEVIRVPKSGYDIGGGNTALVIHAAKNTITLKYTGEDNVVSGYTIHVAGICVEPTLQTLYDQCHAAGRQELPALKSKQAFGRAIATEIKVSIRDTGSWMDPRVRKDWWQGKN